MKEKVSEFFGSGTSIKMSPVQRDYKWDADKAIGLLENIQKGDAFLAAVSYRQDGDTEVISDGCQRITTLSLIAKVYGAFKDFFDDISAGTNVFEYINPEDTNAMKAVINGNSNLSQYSNTRIVKNFKKIQEAYEKDTNKAMTLRNLKTSRLYGMELKQSDNEVEIFLNLNAKGEAMKPFEIVKSFFGEGQNSFTKYDNISQRFEKRMDKFLKVNAGYDQKINGYASNIVEHYSKCNYDINELCLRADSYEKIITNKYYDLIENKNTPMGVITWLFNVQQSTRTDKEDVVNTVLRWLYYNVPYIVAVVTNNNNFQERETDLISQIRYDESLENIKNKLKSFNKSFPDFKDRLLKGLTYNLSSKFIRSVFYELGYTSALKDPTVEHIYAQNCVLGKIDDWHTQCLGNCTLLGRSLNSAAGKKAPVEKFKMPEYTQSGFQPTIDLTKLNKWDLQDIETRHKDFANRWYNLFETM